MPVFAVHALSKVLLALIKTAKQSIAYLYMKHLFLQCRCLMIS